MIINKSDFFKIIDNWNYVPFMQSEGFFKAKEEKHNSNIFILDSIENPNFGCWGKIVKLPLSRGMLYIESYSYKEFVYNNFFDFLRQIIDEVNVDIIYISDDSVYDQYKEKAYRQSGFRRPLGQFGTNLTLHVDLAKLDYKREWKRNIKSASNTEGISFEQIIHYNEETLKQISLLFIENSTNKNLTYYYSKSDLKNFLSDNKFRLYVVKIYNEIIAARVIYVSNDVAYDVCTANGNKSIEYKGITHYLCSNIFSELSIQGVKYFDFSRVPIGRKKAEGVTQFKEGSNGFLVQYSGYWIYTKKNIFRYLLFLVNKYVRRKYEY